MSITIDIRGRDALWGVAMTELSAIGDVYLLASRGDIDGALRLRDRQQDAMDVLDAVGWAEYERAEEVVLDAPPWRAVRVLSRTVNSTVVA
jgi:hypothetical protein